MSQHENLTLMRRTLEAFRSGDGATLGEVFAPDVVWRVPGRSVLAGTYTGQAEVFGLFGKMMELTGGTFRVESLGLLADETGGVFIDRLMAERDGRQLDVRICLAVRIEQGRIVEGIDHFHQEHLWDAFWA